MNNVIGLSGRGNIIKSFQEREGKVVVNKKTWYAHLHKGHTEWKYDNNLSGRIASSERRRCNAYAFDYFWPG
jgi:hypothetical protein